MKRIHLTLVLVTVFCVGFAAQANAGPVGTLEFNLGYVKSSSEIGVSEESMGGGIGFGAGYWRSASPTIQWGVEASYDNLGSAEASYYDSFSDLNVTEEFSTNVLRVGPALRMNFGSMVGPNFFAQGGAGLYNVSWDYRQETDFPSTDEIDGSSSEIGFNLGAGVGFPLGPKTRMNIMGSYHVVPGAEFEGQEVTQDLNNLQFRAGIGIGL